ncbi:MAG: hypothetical protein PHE12_04550 [Clostridia bacterium]|nr:hypothetical protein [Clostridia bacterium]
MIFFKINSKTLSKNPSDIENGKMILQNAERTIDGTLSVDIIAVKDKVTFYWDYLSDVDFKKLKSEINQSAFVIIEYYDESHKSITANAEDISYSPYYSKGTLIWKDVSLSFVEV